MRRLFDLDAIKADLSDRRLRVIVIVVAVALVGAIGYAVLGGGSQSSTPTAAAGPVAAGAGGAPSLGQSSTSSNPNAAKAETTYGAHYQHNAKLVDPFVQLASSTTTTSKTSSAGSSGKSSSGSAGSSKGSGSSSSSSTSAASTPSPSSSSTSSGGSSGASAPSTSPKPKTHTEYRVTVELGTAPNAGESPKLKVYKGVKSGVALPSKSHQLVVLKAASAAGKAPVETPATATFALSSSPIVNGPGKCLPTDTQCESVKLTPGQVEELQYTEAGGQTVAYLLRISAVTTKTSKG
jgi:hypothetical protein